MVSEAAQTQQELLLHPERMQIISEFAGRGQLTVAALRDLLPEVPAATLYRHVALLEKGGVLAVAETRAKRGATEKTYRLAVQPMFSRDYLAAAPQRLAQIVTMTAAMLIRDFTRYFARVDLRKRGADPLIRLYAVFATDDEFRRLCEQLNDLLHDAGKAGAQSPDGRARRMFYLAAVPESEGPA